MADHRPRQSRPPHAGTIDNKTGRRISDDSPIAFDQVAHAALSFVSDEADDGDLIESLADFDGSGYIITRRKPVRSAAKNGRVDYNSMKRYGIFNTDGGGHVAERSAHSAEEALSDWAHDEAQWDGRFKKEWFLKNYVARDIGKAHLDRSWRESSKNGRSRLKRTRLACTRRSNASRKGSSKAASRLATHCPKRRSTKNGRKTITTEYYSPSVEVDTILARSVKVGDVLIPWQSRDGRDTVVDIKRGKRLYEFLVKRGDVIDPFSYELTLMQNPMDEFKIDLAASGRPVPKRRMAKAK
jgi:hypothetical protein